VRNFDIRSIFGGYYIDKSLWYYLGHPVDVFTYYTYCPQGILVSTVYWYTKYTKAKK